MLPPTILDLLDTPLTLAGAFDCYWRIPGVSRRPALTDGERSLTYAKLNERTAGIAAWLRQRGAVAGDVLAITMERSVDTVLLLFAAIRAGLCPCVLEPGLPPGEVEERLLLAGASWLAYDAAHRALVAGLVKANVCAFEMAENLEAAYSRFDDIEPATRALLLFTSGSTGRPKAVVLSQRSLLNNAMGIIGHSGLSARDKLLHCMPIYHTNGLNNQLFAPALSGAAVVFANRFRAAEMPALLEKHRPSIITGVPTMYARMLPLTFTPAALQSLRMARCGSAPITEALHREVEAKLGCPLVVSYGLSEATCTSTMNPPSARRIGSVGTVLAGQCIMVLNARGELTNLPNVDGEVCIYGANLMSSYLGAEDETNRAIVDGWLRTGDMGHFDEDGYVYITGRIKDVIIRGGENLPPQMIENAIMAHPGVAACCVVAGPDPDLGEVPVAFVVPQPGATLVAEAICHTVLGRLSRIYVPHAVHVLEALPENAVGKVDRKALSARTRPFQR